MIKEKQTILNTKEILYDVDIIKDIVFTKDKIILSSYIEEIILEYFLKELGLAILFFLAALYFFKLSFTGCLIFYLKNKKKYYVLNKKWKTR